MKKEKINICKEKEISGGKKTLIGENILIDGKIDPKDKIVILKSPRNWTVTSKNRFENQSYFNDIRYDLGVDFLSKKGININTAEMIDCSDS